MLQELQHVVFFVTNAQISHRRQIFPQKPHNALRSTNAWPINVGIDEYWW
jgi:hypothetical protein